MKWRVWLVPLGALVLVVVVIAVYAGLYFLARPTAQVALGTPIRQDDFTYTVVHAAKAQTLVVNGRSIRARGSFYIVTVRLDNNAVRVPFEWRDDIAQLVDAHGNKYRVDTNALGSAPAYERERSVPAGQNASFMLVFDVPKTIEQPLLVFDNGIMMGDAFNFVAYRRMGVVMP